MHMKKGVSVRAAIAASALSISSIAGVRAHNKVKYLKEAEAVWEMGQTIGLEADGKDEEVIQKIMELEEADDMEKEGGAERKGSEKISFVSHYVGGLVARYAIGSLYHPPNHSSSDNLSRGTVGGLEAINFITVATPHLGSMAKKQFQNSSQRHQCTEAATDKLVVLETCKKLYASKPETTGRKPETSIPNHVAIKIALELKKLLIDNSLLDVYGTFFILSLLSSELYEPNSSFEQDLDSFFTSAVNSASGSSFNSFGFGNNGTATNNEAVAAVYGLYQCRGDLKASDCGSCIQSLVSQIAILCPYSYGASLQLDGCFVKYEHVNFLGVLDTTVVYKKCSGGGASNGDVETTFIRRRDEVLADLQRPGNDRFHVSSSGLVQGMAQCVGDLSNGDCLLCLSEAVSQLKNLCGPIAATAQIFLGKCYVEYWETGYFDLTSGTTLLSMNFLLFSLIFFSVSITLSALKP
ncbi:hypothetical protein Dimus_028878 [Dionaea muscipula]